MAQLIMSWYNDGSPATPVTLPERIEVKRFPEVPDGVDAWLGIIRYMEQEDNPNIKRDVFRKCLLEWPDFEENLCFFLTVNGEPTATITVVCHREKKQGYIHMVACKPGFRGKGLGHLMNQVAVYTLKKEGMESAYLTTDDWRLAAIKTYLKADFVPDLESKPDFRERWDKILLQLEQKK